VESKQGSAIVTSASSLGFCWLDRAGLQSREHWTSVLADRSQAPPCQALRDDPLLSFAVF
jgi:hypothetical protein